MPVPDESTATAALSSSGVHSVTEPRIATSSGPFVPSSCADGPFPTGALDHSSFPHLLDRVLEHADSPTLLALAATSHGVRARVQPHLYRHILLCSGPDHGQDPLSVVHIACAPWRVLNLWSSGIGDDSRTWMAKAEREITNTECVDIGSVNVGSLPYLALPRLKVVRTAVAGVEGFPFWHPAPPRSVTTSSIADVAEEHSTKWGLERSTTHLPFEEWERVHERIFVIHMDLVTWPPQPAWLYDLEYSDEEEGSSYHASRPSAVLQVAMPNETQRLVLHLHWDGALRPGTDVQIPPHALELYADIVIVLHPPRPSSAERERGDDGWFATLLSHVIKVAVQRLARVVIVGVEGCTDADLGMRPRPHPVAKWQRTPTAPQPLRRGEDLVAAVTRLMGGTFERAWCDVTSAQMEACRALWREEGSDVEGLSEQVKLITGDEWRRTADPLETGSVPMLDADVVEGLCAQWTA